MEMPQALESTGLGKENRLKKIQMVKIEGLKMRTPALIVVALTGILLASQPVRTLARDCGMPPGNGPVIPDGVTATNEEIGIAIRAIQDYGFEVRAYTDCLQLNKENFFLNMTEDQRERWAEDFNTLADNLTDLENSLNEQIRIFNSRS
jgi:hypothetical protein